MWDLFSLVLASFAYINTVVKLYINVLLNVT